MANEKTNETGSRVVPSTEVIENEEDTLIVPDRRKKVEEMDLVELEPSKTDNSMSNGDRMLDETIVDPESRDLSPLEDRIAKESVVTIDTTDKRSNRNALRAQHTFAAKKTVAQGMMDVALITANANQLRYLVEYQRNSPTFFVNVFLIVISLLLQIAVGVSLIFKGRFDMQGKGKSSRAVMINNYVVVGVFLITIINVFVAAFSVTATPSSSSTTISVPNSVQATT